MHFIASAVWLGVAVSCVVHACSASSLSADRKAFYARVAAAHGSFASPSIDRVDGVSAPNATVLCGPARFTVLTSTLVRLEWGGKGSAGSYVFDDR